MLDYSPLAFDAVEDTVILDLAPPVVKGAAGMLGADVAPLVVMGRRLVDILADEALREEIDCHPDPLAALARDASVRAALATASASRAG
jgi:hypothetical protein